MKVDIARGGVGPGLLASIPSYARILLCTTAAPILRIYEEAVYRIGNGRNGEEVFARRGVLRPRTQPLH